MKTTNTMKTTYLKLITAFIFIAITSCNKDENIQPVNDITTKSINEKMSLQNASTSQDDFILGINGHPLSSDPYIKTSPTKQMELLKELGFSHYRFDLWSMSTGGMSLPYLYNPLKRAADAASIKLLPIMDTRTLNLSVDTIVSYKNGLKLGANFASIYKDHFDYYALGKELESKFIYAGKSGASTTHYDKAKFKIVAAYLKGIDEGIKSEDPTAKTMVDGGWLHFGYIQLLEEAHVKFDIVAWNWYSNMESVAAAAPNNIPDITVHLSTLFNKPIWFTEVSHKYGSSTTLEKDQDEFFQNFIVKCKNNPKVKAVLINQLFDEPDRSTTLGNSGLIKWTNKYTSWEFKISAKTFKLNKPELPGPEEEEEEEAPKPEPIVNRTDFMMGISGHPFSTAPYKNTPATTQIQMIKDMKMDYYRFDAWASYDGSIDPPALWRSLRNAAIAANIKMLPVLVPRTLNYNSDAATSYKNGKILGSNFAAKNGQYFDYYEIGNEMENHFILPNKSGESLSHYNLAKLEIVAAYLKGMDEGIKAIDPTAKTMVNSGWLHFAYIQKLIDAGVKFDIVAWHWYSEMERLAINDIAIPIPDITKKLSSMFPGKPIWITEFNTRSGSLKEGESGQDLFIQNFIAKCKNNPNVKTIIIYELLDQPEHRDSTERDYGMSKWKSRYTDWEYKMAGKKLTATL